MHSSELTIDKLKKYERANTTILEFFRLSTWTIATGAMLVSGVLPPPESTKIPEKANQLLNSALPATAAQLREACAVLERWTWDHQGDDGSEPVPTEASPVEFVQWCGDSFKHPDFFPDLLGYFLELITPSDNIRPARRDMAERLLELEQHATVERARFPLDDTGATPSVAPQKTAGFTDRMTVLIKEKKIKSPIAMEIAKALDKASSGAIPNASRVWPYLCDIARSGEYELLKLEGSDEIMIPYGTGRKTYTRTALEQFLRRNRKLLTDV
jgi:hypothetical protein